MAEILAPPLPENPGAASHWPLREDSANSLALAAAARRAAGPLLVVCVDTEASERLLRELRYFLARHEDVPVLSLPDWETLPYENFSPHQDIVSQRLSALHQLPRLKRGVLVLPVSGLLLRLPPQSHVAANSLDLRVGQRLAVGEFREQLVAAGYNAVETVLDHAEFAVRGSVVDLFPMGSPAPIRIDLFDEEIDTLRSFDPETQRTRERIEAVRLLPGREFPLDEAAVTGFRGRFRERFDVDPMRCPVYRDVSDGLASPGLEYYLPLFFDALQSLFDYLPANTLTVQVGDIHNAGEAFLGEVANRHRERSFDPHRPILRPDEIFLPVNEALAGLKRHPRIRLTESAREVFRLRQLPEVAMNPRLASPLRALRGFLEECGARVLFCAESPGRRENLQQRLGQIGLEPRLFEHFEDFINGESGSDANIGIAVAPIDRGLWLEQAGQAGQAGQASIVLITEEMLFGNKVAQRRRRRRSQQNPDLVLKNLSELHLDDAVVHVEHGVGRYRGLAAIDTDGLRAEFLTIEYDKGAKLYVPVADLQLVSRYGGSSEDEAPLNTLGTDHWRRAKKKAAEKIRDAAAELLEIHARREAGKGFAYRCDTLEYDRFAAAFPFEETADQQSAIEAVISDMAAPRPMDRLVCGDVGFGKTEVAMRAAFITVANGRQAAVLVPTTLLAQQHFENFRDRFSDWPHTVEVISRFKTPSEQAEILQRVKSGGIDILIGTHSLLTAKIDYDQLGLLIIDEEHRFGVRQKEKLKSIRASVDILTLTATPIPRTLNMALADMRDLSLIVTPPAKRLSIRTFVREHDAAIVKEAISRELLRGGQVFYLHNEVRSMERTLAQIEELLPQARPAMAHGQMPERQLEKVMADFYHKRHNVLVCSTIIETGIDIPSANTIIIRRADQFGLAQLHQLRGRVGRSHHQAYAYLLIPDRRGLRADARKRIEAIESATELGAGFTLASHDLEIRGAGELLGEEQSGHMQKIGYTLYMEMLLDAVKAIREGRMPSSSPEREDTVEINLRIPALIPEDYLPDVHTRLILYKRIASCRDSDELDELQVEMIDRFGLLPAPLKSMFRLGGIKLRARHFGIRKIDATVAGGRIEFAENTQVDPGALVRLVETEPMNFGFGGANQLQLKAGFLAAKDKLDYIDTLLDRIAASDSAIARTA